MRIAAGIAAGAMALGMLSGWDQPPALAQMPDPVATPSQAATVPVRVRQGAAEAAILELWIRSYTPPRRGAVEAIVSLVRGASDIEVGRFAVFPSEPFAASSQAEERGYSFDAARALAALRSVPGELAVRVRLAPIDAAIAPEGARLVVARAELGPRP